MLNDPEWMQEILRASESGLWTIFLDEKNQKKEMYASDMMLKLLGLLEHPEPDICFTHWDSRIEDKYRKYVDEYINQMIETGRFLEVQYRWKHPWWGDIFIRCGGRAERLEDGVIRLRGYHQNVNELELLKRENRIRDAEIEEIKQQKRSYDDLFNSVLCGIVTYKRKNLRLVFKKINHEALEIFQYTPKEFWSREEWDVSDLIAKEDISVFLQTMNQLKNVGDKVSREMRLLTQNGKKIWIIENTELIRDIDGDEVYQSVFIDINDNKEKTVLLQDIAENIPGGVCLLDIETRNVIYGNEGFYHLFGCTEKELKEQYNGGIDDFIRRADNRYLEILIREAILKGTKGIQHEMQIVRPNNTKIWVLVKGTIINSQGSLQLSCVLIDITDRKNMEKELYLNERRLSIALEQTANVVFDFDIQSGSIILKNGNFGIANSGEIVDNAPENLVAMGILHKDFKKTFYEMWKQLAGGEEKVSKEVLVSYEPGEPYLWTKAVLRTIYSENGIPLRAVGILEDISLQKSIEFAFKKEEKYRQAMLAETIASAEINVTKNVIEKSSGLWKQGNATLNMTYDEILDFMLEKEIFSDDRELYATIVSRKSFKEYYKKGKLEIKLEHRRINLKGQVQWRELTGHILKEPDSGDLKALIYLKDIDQKKQSELMMKYQSERDSLTGLYNKGTAELLMTKFLEEEQRPNVCHAFIIMDLDHFKVMNDSYGHQYGDEVLKMTAAIIKDTFRADDIQGRLGGDEMVILMKNIPSRQCVEERLELIKKNLGELATGEIRITTSIGISLFKEHGSTYQELYKNADIALYKAKESGRDQYVLYSPEMKK